MTAETYVTRVEFYRAHKPGHHLEEKQPHRIRVHQSPDDAATTHNQYSPPCPGLVAHYVLIRNSC